MVPEVLTQGEEELHAALAELEAALAGAAPDEVGAVRLDDDDQPVVPVGPQPDAGEQQPLGSLAATAA
ncbi:hypothetical protein [Planobispora longispora]|uniref:Uncharacterized protein n=1 Tax=Planobispora longispora TaxID=28887 RepID=A0A8J3RTM9_9ACTN|nr:hypothetical protein [Planobispora longispora]GIH78043.1 hypothetical protein Plo01_44720 [Planobispora longispora]